MHPPEPVYALCPNPPSIYHTGTSRIDARDLELNSLFFLCSFELNSFSVVLSTCLIRQFAPRGPRLRMKPQGVPLREQRASPATVGMVAPCSPPIQWGVIRNRGAKLRDTTGVLRERSVFSESNECDTAIHAEWRTQRRTGRSDAAGSRRLDAP